MKNVYVLYVYQQLAVWEDKEPENGNKLDIMSGRGKADWWYLTGTDSLWMVPGTYQDD